MSTSEASCSTSFFGLACTLPYRHRGACEVQAREYCSHPSFNRFLARTVVLQSTQVLKRDPSVRALLSPRRSGNVYDVCSGTDFGPASYELRARHPVGTVFKHTTAGCVHKASIAP